MSPERSHAIAEAVGRALDALVDETVGYVLIVASTSPEGEVHYRSDLGAADVVQLLKDCAAEVACTEQDAS